MQLPPSSLVGSIVERKPGSSSLKTVSAPSHLGFPLAQHRAKSAFARAREAKRNGSRDGEDTRTKEVSIVHSNGSLLSGTRTRQGDMSLASDEFSGSSKNTSVCVTDDEQWKSQMRAGNERTISSMSEEERNRHAAEIIEQLGPNVAELLRKAREARAQADARPAGEETSRGRARHDDGESHHANDASASKADISQPAPASSTAKKFASPPRGILSLPTSRASSPGRHARKLRFADVTPKDVYVYQSEPSSPRRPIGLLLPPPDQDNSNADVEMIPAPGSEPQHKPGPEPKSESVSRLEEGTPEYIRKHFFPDARKDPALEWIEGDSSENNASNSEPRFGLSGAIIPVPLQDSLSTHLGLHHHSGSSAAGYTLSDLYLLARSSVPAQRATVLCVLSKLVRRLALREREASGINDREGARSKTLVLGLAALPEKGTVGVRAIDVVWTCVVYWDQGEVSDLNGLELRPVAAKTGPVDEEYRIDESLPSSDPISSLPFSALLPQVVALLGSQTLPQEARAQLLSILHRFARHSVEIATAICETPRLVASVVDAFLLTPIPPPEHGPLPNPLALDFLNALVVSSRSNARALKGPIDALLRFITTANPLSSSPFPRPLAEALLRGTLDSYATLGMYGLYSGIATTAAEHFTRLSSSILRSTDGDASDELRESWLHLLSVWMICAVDPHRTTPTHDLLWSQVAGWAWGNDLLECRILLLSRETKPNKRLWGALWEALASWLEGCRVNSTRSGQDERDSVNATMGECWEGAVERGVVKRTVSHLEQELTVANEEAQPFEQKDRLERVAMLCRILASFTRLCVSCMSSPSSRSSDSAGEVVGPNTPLWVADSVCYLSRASSLLLSSKILASIGSPEARQIDLAFRMEVSHMRFASTFLAHATKLLQVVSTSGDWLPTSLAVLQTLLPGDEEGAQWIVGAILDRECTKIDCGDKMQYLMPFFKNMIRPDDTFHLSPLVPTPESIEHSTTQCLPASCTPGLSARTGVTGLPLNPDWPCIVLDHLLRSGTSPILTNPDSVPESWNASEPELVQASLSLMLHAQKTLGSNGWKDFSPTFEHVVFNCMKIFMLEHNQQQGDSDEEVFRDLTVGRLMEALLEAYTLQGSQYSVVRIRSNSNLEVIARGFLGEGTPFFQFYTDFVTLYDAISFSHKTFARILLPPTSMAYPPDYRKLLWGDFGHMLRTIRTPIEEVPSLDIKEFFWPVETDAEMLGWYLRGLVKLPLDGFVRLLAAHHLACSIWPDLQYGGGATRDDEKEMRSRMLLAAIFNQGESDVAKEVVRYVQPSRNEFLFPPACFNAKEETRRARLAFAQHLGENKISESVERIFNK